MNCYHTQDRKQVTDAFRYGLLGFLQGSSIVLRLQVYGTYGTERVCQTRFFYAI
jgi:hypothetical protein